MYFWIRKTQKGTSTMNNNNENIQYQEINNKMLNEQSIKQWATLVMEQEVKTIHEIQQIEFAQKLFEKIDYEFFKNEQSAKPISFIRLFEKVGAYYQKQIGINIRHLLNDLNVFTSVSQLWELALGVAIKGGNREKNINIILKMNSKAQQQLMRIVSNIINKLGDNVSIIQKQSSSQIYESDNNLLLQLSQENEQLKEKVEELRDKIKKIKSHAFEQQQDYQRQIEGYRKEKYMIYDLFELSKLNIKVHGNLTVLDMVKDLLIYARNQNKDLDAKEQKLFHIEESNRNMKAAYSTLMDQVNKKEKEMIIKEEVIIDKEVQSLREQNMELFKREQELLTKIQELQSQKYYLKSVAYKQSQDNSRYSQHNPQQQSIYQSNAITKRKHPLKDSISDNADNNMVYEVKAGKESVVQRDSVRDSMTVRKEIKEASQPKVRSRLQSQVKHLKQKNKKLMQRNESLMRINNILEKTIQKFTLQNEQLIRKYQQQYQNIAKQANTIVQTTQHNNHKQEQLVSIISKLQYRISQLQSQLLSKNNINQQQQTKQQPQPIQEHKEQQQHKQISQQQQPKQQQKDKIQSESQHQETQQPKEQAQQIQPEVQVQLQTQIQVQSTQQVQPQPQLQSMKEEVPQIIISHPQQQQPQPQSQQQKVEEQQDGLKMSKQMKRQGSVILDEVDEQDDEPHMRKRQYSFMRNKQLQCRLSHLHIIQEEQTNTKPKQPIQHMFMEEDGSSSQGQLLDITKIQEDLLKIKQNYKRINTQYKELYEWWNTTSKSSTKESVVDNTLLDMAGESKIRCALQVQNRQLIAKVRQLQKQRNRIRQRVGRQRMQGMQRMVMQIGNMMKENEYLNPLLLQQMSKGNMEKQTQLMDTKQSLYKAEQQIQQLNTQIDVLCSTLLEMRMEFVKMKQHQILY